MLRITPIKGVIIGGTQQAIYTAPDSASNNRAVITKLVVTNTGDTDDVFSVWLIPKGGGAAVANKLYDRATIAANSTKELYEAEGLSMAKGDTLEAVSDGGVATNIKGTVMEYL